MSFLNSLAGVIGGTFVTLGLESPTARALAFGTVGFAIQYFIRPGVSYINVPTKDGGKCISKQFTLLANKESNVPTTLFPWYFWPLLFALIGGLFL
jgi:hypothetical protein